MATKTRTFARVALWALPVWALMLFISVLTHQPDPQTAFADFSAYTTTTQFLVSHILNSIIGASIGSIGVIGLMLYLQDTRVAGRAIIGMVASVAGNTINSSIFGVAAFAQPAMGQMFLSGQQNAFEFYNLVYGAPLFGTALFAILLFLIGGILLGNAISASGVFPRWAGWLFSVGTIGFVLTIMFFSDAQSVAAALLFVGSLVVALSGSRQNRSQAVPVAVSP